MSKINYMQIVKIAVGSCIAILLADALGLKYSVSAGIITLLSIQNTKKETILIAGKRFLSFVLSIIISYLIFQSIGYHPYSFGLFLLVFVALSYLFDLEDGISMNAVLTTHFLLEESMSYYWIKNEILLLLIGSGIGILLNLYIPRKIGAIKEDQIRIEEDIKLILKRMSFYLTKEDKEDYTEQCFAPLDVHIQEALSRAFENINNTLLSDTRYYLHYMQMRKSQQDELKRIYSHIKSLDSVPEQAFIIANFMEQVTSTFHEYNNALSLIEGLQEIQIGFKSDSLPINRKEFENRAVLYQILNELETFLILKRDFVASLSEMEIQSYWKQEL